MVNVRFEEQAVPPSTCVTLVRERPQLSVALTCAFTLASAGILAGAGLQPRLPPAGEPVITGGVVSITVTVWLQVLVWPQASLINQVRVATNGQAPLLVPVLKVTL